MQHFKQRYVNHFMEAKELRIGNYVYPFDDIELVDSKQIFRDCIQVKEISYLTDFDENKEGYLINENWMDEFQPIPLTEEWLLRFGFEYRDYDDCYVKSGFEYYINPVGENRIEKILHSYIMEEFQPKINHVHQLQNLYFALTGQELELT